MLLLQLHCTHDLKWKKQSGKTWRASPESWPSSLSSELEGFLRRSVIYVLPAYQRPRDHCWKTLSHLHTKHLLSIPPLNIWEVKSFIRMSANQQNWCDLKGLFWSLICVLISSRGLFGLLRLKQSPVCPWSDRKKLEDQIQGSYLWCANCALHKTTNFDNTFKILCPWNWKIRFRASAQNLQCASCALHKTEQMW